MAAFADGGQRIPQLVAEDGQEFVFLPIVLLEQPEELFPLLLGPLAVGDVLDGEEDRLVFALGGEASGR